ncbi:hypothetical protein V1286_005584 [Bradyrhizobium algeriense]|uniref:Transposase n=1 Tax=Bradyrhizobium algeriense TaxID=634784 RepID=A0ABU8BHN6_9BRAD
MSGFYHRLAIGRRATNKRQPTVPLPDRLLVHMRRWYDKTRRSGGFGFFGN